MDVSRVLSGSEVKLATSKSLGFLGRRHFVWRSAWQFQKRGRRFVRMGLKVAYHQYNAIANNDNRHLKPDPVLRLFREMVSKSKTRANVGALRRPCARQTTFKTKLTRDLTWELCAEKTLDSLDTLRPSAFATIFNCCKKGGYMDTTFLAKLSSRVLAMPNFYGDYNARDVAMMVQSLGMLARDCKTKRGGCSEDGTTFLKNCSLIVKHIVVACAQLVWFLREDFGVRELSSIAHGMGLVFQIDEGMGMDEDIRDAFDFVAREFVSKTQQSGCTPFDASNFLHGCANVRYDNKEVLRSFCRRLEVIVRSIGVMQNQQLANIFWALGKLDVRDIDSLLYALEVNATERMDTLDVRELSCITYGCGLLGYTSSAFVERLCEQIVQEGMLKKFRNKPLGMVMYGLGGLEYGNEVVLGKLGNRVVELLEDSECSPHDLTIYAYSFGCFKHTDHNVLRMLAQCVVGKCQHGELDKTYQLPAIVYSFGRARFYEEGIYRDLIRGCEASLGDFDYKGLSNVIYGLASLKSEGIEHSQELVPFLDKVACEVKSRGWTSLNEQAATNLCWSFARLRYLDEDLLHGLLARYTKLVEQDGVIVGSGIVMSLYACALLRPKRCEEFVELAIEWVDAKLEGIEDSQSICNCMWSLALLDCLTAPLFERSCRKVMQLEAAKKVLDKSTVGQIIQCEVYMTSIKQCALDAEIKEFAVELRKTWNTHDVVSGFEHEIHDVLVELDVPYSTHSGIVDGCGPVDVLVHTKPPFVIEVDGPSHYTMNKYEGGYRQMGDTLFRNRLIEANGFKVVCIPYYEWVDVKDDQDQAREWVKDKLRGGWP